MEEQVVIQCGEITLEGRLARMEGERGVVIAHPHPLHGGDMSNPVVMAIKNAYTRLGYSTLRFNFRGVGASQGAHDNGIGEQMDVRAGIGFLKAAGIRHIDLAGYSFGAWVIARLSPSPEGTNRMLLLSPPAGLMDFSGMNPSNLSIRLIAGSRDDFAPPDAIQALLDKLGTATGLVTIPGADHFFSGQMQPLASAIWNAIK